MEGQPKEWIVPAHLKMPEEDEKVMRKAWVVFERMKLLNTALQVKPVLESEAFIPPEEMSMLEEAAKLMVAKNYGRIIGGKEMNIHWYTPNEIEQILQGKTNLEQTFQGLFGSSQGLFESGQGLFYESGQSEMDDIPSNVPEGFEDSWDECSEREEIAPPLKHP